MLYNADRYPAYLKTAGKITIFTAFVGVGVFMLALSVDIGKQELSRVHATGTASTTLIVLNTPPTFTVGAREVIESATSTPTNSGDVIQWAALANDSNGAPYFLLVCSTNATPTANNAAGPGSLGTAPPDCGAGATKWAVSTATPSDSLATAGTTTTEAAPFGEIQDWFAWVCDDDPSSPQCSVAFSQGTNATNSSPFNVNSRPVLTAFGNDGPIDPGGTLNFLSTSTDPDSVGGADTLKLVVCQTSTDYSTTTNTCAANFLASTTIGVTANATTSYTLGLIVRDGTYPAYAFIVDEHGHEAIANPIQQDFDVNNVAPTVLSGNIFLNGGLDMDITVPGDETLGFTLDFEVSDANSCVNASAGDEITGFQASVFRSSYGTSTCDTTAGSYDPNYCYPSGAPPATWNLSCTASTTSCTGPTDDTQLFECTFPLWFVADPTDAGPETPAAFAADSWTAAVAGIDDNFATGTLSTTSSPVEVVSLTALDLLSSEIPYGELAPGDNTGTLSASTSVLSVGNTGLDQLVSGESMCGTFSLATECAVSATSTIPESEQQFATSSLAYNDPSALTLSSSTLQELELDVLKSTSTSSPASGVTYFGIEVPISITLAGSYEGLNTFVAKTAEAIDWTP